MCLKVSSEPARSQLRYRQRLCSLVLCLLGLQTSAPLQLCCFWPRFHNPSLAHQQHILQNTSGSLNRPSRRAGVGRINEGAGKPNKSQLGVQIPHRPQTSHPVKPRVHAAIVAKYVNVLQNTSRCFGAAIQHQNSRTDGGNYELLSHDVKDACETSQPCNTGQNMMPPA